MSSDSNKHSQIGAHAEYIIGAAAETIGSVTHSAEWTEAGKKEKKHAIADMRAAANAHPQPHTTNPTLAGLERKAGVAFGCEGMVDEGARVVDGDSSIRSPASSTSHPATSATYIGTGNTSAATATAEDPLDSSATRLNTGIVSSLKDQFAAHTRSPKDAFNTTTNTSSAATRTEAGGSLAVGSQPTTTGVATTKVEDSLDTAGPQFDRDTSHTATSLPVSSNYAADLAFDAKKTV